MRFQKSAISDIIILINCTGKRSMDIVILDSALKHGITEANISYCLSHFNKGLKPFDVLTRSVMSVQARPRHSLRSSIMAIVAAVACGLFKIVASIYKPFSVKAFGCTVECFRFLNRWKFSTSSPLSASMI